MSTTTSPPAARSRTALCLHRAYTALLSVPSAPNGGEGVVNDFMAGAPLRIYTWRTTRGLPSSQCLSAHVRSLMVVSATT